MTPAGNEQETKDETVRQAAAWFARLRDCEPTETVRRDFRAWLAESPENHEAFRNIKSLWYTLDRPAQLAGADRWYREGLGVGRRRRKLKNLATAAAVCLVCLCSAALWRDDGLIDRAFADYATVPGERREVRLDDGSVVFLDGDSAIDVVLTLGERNVRLIRGRAWFDVTPDLQRPFVVAAGQVETKVLGTAFAVDTERESVDVTVERGNVAVSSGLDDAVELTAGESVSFKDDRLGEKSAADLDISLAWRRGLLVMNHTPLDKVASELSRMSSGRVILRQDGTYPEMYLSGVFKVSDPDAILSALRAANLHAVRIPGVATIIYR